MSYLKEVNRVIKEIRESGGEAPKIIRRNWDTYDLSDRDVEFLAQLGFTELVTAGLRRSPERSESVSIRITSGTEESEPEPKYREVRVSILELVSLEGADGSRKKLFHFTSRDATVYIQHGNKQVVGIQRKNKAMAHIKNTLILFKKKEVSELAQGERNIIERMWKAAEEGRDWSEEHDRS